MQFRTKNTLYTLIQDGEGDYVISGHENFCPKATKCKILDLPIVGRSFFFKPEGRGTVRTTAVQEIIL